MSKEFGMQGRSKVLIAVGLVWCLLLGGEVAYAEERVQALAAEVEGVIEAIDLAERVATISGYDYSFSDSGEEFQPEVKMYGSEFGAFELLQPGMKVYVVFAEFHTIRAVLSLQQLADNAVITEY